MRTIAVAAMFVLSMGGAVARDVSISVWAGGTGPNDVYRLDAIEIAAGLLAREAAIQGKTLNIKVEKKAYPGWDDFKQAVTLSAEAGNAPDIVATGHEDIAPWAQSGLIVPIENYIDLDSWPANDIYENLLRIASYSGVVYGLPEDAESRPFFFWKPHMKAIGYSDADIDALPAKIAAGTYTLATVLEDAKKMQDKGVVKPGYGFYPRPNNGPDYWQFYRSFGGEMDDPKSGKLVFDKGAMARFYQFFVDAVAAGVTRKNHIGTPNDQWFAEVASGKAGIWHGGTWHYARYVGQEGLKRLLRHRAVLARPGRRQDRQGEYADAPGRLSAHQACRQGQDGDRRAIDRDRIRATHQCAARDQIGASGDMQTGVEHPVLQQRSLGA